jgi:hypothetical protein
MADNVRNAALQLIPLIIEPSISINNNIKKIIFFFGSQIKSWEDRNFPEKYQPYSYRLEFKIVRWILISHSKLNYSAVKDILESFVETGFWLSIDFALGAMEFILKFIYPNDKEKIEDGYNTMKRWVEKFEKNSDIFYMALTQKEKNPLLFPFNPLSQTATIDLLRTSNYKQGPIDFLLERLQSPQIENAQLALLATRNFWRANPQRVLDTLEYVINYKDVNITNWLNSILKDIYSVYPGLMEKFFDRCKSKFFINHTRIQEIKHSKDIFKARGLQYNDSPLYEALFFYSEDRRKIFAEWYKKLLQSSSLEDYCDELIMFLIKKVCS